MVHNLFVWFGKLFTILLEALKYAFIVNQHNAVTWISLQTMCVIKIREIGNNSKY